MIKETPNYYAVLPGPVRGDDRLTHLAKLLFAELTALSNKEGFAWAGNKYLAGVFGVTPRTITTTIAQLKEFGYITVEYTHDSHRRVFVANIVPGGVEKNFQGVAKENSGGVEADFQQNNIPITPKGKTIKKKSFNRDWSLAVLAEAMVFDAKVQKILAPQIPLSRGEQATFQYYRQHLSKLGPQWLKRGTQKLMAAKRYADNNGLDETFLKKSFSRWMVRTAGYRPKEKI